MTREELRDQLFAKYFEVEDGILVTDIVEKLSFIPQLYRKLHILCEKNVPSFDSFCTLEQFRFIINQDKPYLILKTRIFDYIIIDMENRMNITELEFKKQFNEEFFVHHFNEKKLGDDENWFDYYCVDNYLGDIQELANFYFENQQVFSLKNQLYYQIQIGNAFTYFCIDFANNNAIVSFQTPNQFLYDQLFLNYDLTPFRMQDAHSRIGIEKMNQMFDKIKDIKIPKNEIPVDLYQQILVQCHNAKQKTIKKISN